MAIASIQGTPGSGKSAFAVSMGLDHLRKGGVVAANFDLVDDWAMQVAKRSFDCRWGFKDPYEVAACLHDRFRVIGSLDGVYDACKDLIPRALPNIQKQFEGHGLLIMDESQLIFNSRAWQKNMAWIEFFSQHRKHKWEVLLVSHSVEMIDSQVRNFIEFDVRFRNLNKVKVPVLGFPVSRLFFADNVFLSIWRYFGLGAGSGNIFKRELTKLCLWEARLYDSMKIFSQVQTVQYSKAGALPVRPAAQPAQPLPQVRPFLEDLKGLSYAKK